MESDQLTDALRRLTGRTDATFRDGQREAIEALVERRERALVVQRTGWGKSAVYFLSTFLLRERGAGPTLLVSPLLALMRNQIEAAERLGLRSMTINSSNNTTVHELADALAADSVDLVLVSPERLANPEFAAKIMPTLGARPGLVVIDEVHCISDWGHDFRPDYRRIGRIVDRLSGSNVPVLGCTATANDRVVQDVAAQLGAEMTTFRGPLRRDGLALSAIPLDRQAERLAFLAEAIPLLEGSGIVYCLTVRDVQNVAEWLQQRGVDAAPYYGSLDGDARVAAERRLQTNDLKVLVATTALGMGYDKPDLSFVVHFQAPGSPVAYYQQVGRAGRALDRSIGVLLRGVEDEQIQDFFIERAFADESTVSDIIAAFDASDEPLSLIRVQNQLNVGRGTLELVVKQLDVDGALRRVGGQTFERTLVPYAYPTERVASVTAARRAEQQSMRDYFSATCRMRYLSNLLDDPTDEPCGVCDNCAGPTSLPAQLANIAAALPVELLAEAELFLQRRPIEIRTKKQRFDEASGGRRKIPESDRPEDGRALSILGDAGWGALVRQATRQSAGDPAFDPRLVDALVDLLSTWGPSPAPTWVTGVPSLRRPRQVADVAAQVAARLGLPYIPAITKVVERPPQRDQLNSAHQQLNIEGAFAVEGAALPEPVLLIDGLIDSGWTLTEAARVLLRAGAGPVYPVALASVGPRG